MRSSMRAAVALVTGALAMALGGSALAAVNPILTIGSTTQGGATTVTVSGAVSQNDDAVARIQIYLPAAYQLRAPAGGAAVGTAAAQALSTQIGGGLPNPTAQIYKMVGDITAIATTDPAVAWENANCATQNHLAAWMVNIQGGDVSWSFPIFVDQTTGGETAFGTHKLVVCFRPLQGSNMEPYGNKLLSMTLNLNVFKAPQSAGAYRFRSLWTPFGAQGTAINQDASVEAQSIVTLSGAALSLVAKRNGKLVRLSGRAVSGGKPLAGAIVALRHGKTRTKLFPMRSFRTSSTGTFARTVRLVSTPRWYRVSMTVGGESLAPSSCVASFGSGVPCVSATQGRVGIVSRFVGYSR